MISTIDRVQAQADDIQWIKILLSVLAAPFYAIGYVLGFTLVVCSWVAAAVMVGVTDARKRGSARGSG